MNKLSAAAIILALAAPFSAAQASDHKALNAIPPHVMDANEPVNAPAAPVAAANDEVKADAEAKPAKKAKKHSKKHAKKHAKKAAPSEVKTDTAK